MIHTTIALITDFGDSDGFTGVIKGVMLHIHPQVRLIDIAHHIPPHDVRHAGWVLAKNIEVFPAGTFFLCVVDPHVGAPGQCPLAVYWPTLQKGCILPDNGLITRVLLKYPGAQCRVLENSRYFRVKDAPSQTFHGRDIYAPVAAHLTKAYAEDQFAQTFQALGPVYDCNQLQQLVFSQPQRIAPQCLQGEVDVVDTYGNLITNIPADWIPEDTSQMMLILGGQRYPIRCAKHYTEGHAQKSAEVAMGLVSGSHGMAEIFLPQGHAQSFLHAKPGDMFQLMAAE